MKKTKERQKQRKWRKLEVYFHCLDISYNLGFV